MINTKTCQAEIEAKAVVLAGQEMAKGLRRLKRALRACDQCEDNEDCNILRSYNQQIQVAISEITSEWGLT